jgi:cell shape-determining protein MreC
VNSNDRETLRKALDRLARLTEENQNLRFEIETLTEELALAKGDYRRQQKIAMAARTNRNMWKDRAMGRWGGAL